MKLLSSQTDEASFLDFGREVVSLLVKRDFQSLVERFDYVMASGTSPIIALEEDFQSCIADFHTSSEPHRPVLPSTVVKYFTPNDTGLFALVECVFAAEGGCPFLAELIVTSSGEDKHVFLEQVSPATGYYTLQRTGVGGGANSAFQP